MMWREKWRFVRDKAGPWMEVIWNSKEHADSASAAILSDDRTLRCIERKDGEQVDTGGRVG